MLLTVHKLFEDDFWQTWLKFCDKMDQPIWMRIIYNINYCYATRMKSGDKFLISLAKLVLKTKASIYSSINPLSANPMSNTLKQFVNKLPTNCLSVFDHFVKLVLKELIKVLKYWKLCLDFKFELYHCILC